MSETEFGVEIGDFQGDRIEIILEISIADRPIKNYIPIILIKDTSNRINGYNNSLMNMTMQAYWVRFQADRFGSVLRSLLS